MRIKANQILLYQSMEERKLLVKTENWKKRIGWCEKWKPLNCVHCTCFSSATQVSEFFFHIQKREETLIQLTCDLIIICIFSFHRKFFFLQILQSFLHYPWRKKEKDTEVLFTNALFLIYSSREATQSATGPREREGRQLDLPPRDQGMKHGKFTDGKLLLNSTISLHLKTK